MSEKRFTTDELVTIIENYESGSLCMPVPRNECDAIIARLRNADKLCEAAKEYLAGGEEWQGNDLDKTIAEYEGKI